MTQHKNDYCVIMCGGVGSRFWPVSRTNLPKQFLDFFGTGRTLIQQTFDRLSKVVPKENVFVVSNERYAQLIQEQLPELQPSQILLEPTRRNTAPCIAWAAYHIRAINPNANIIVSPSDHLILKEGDFIDALKNGLKFVAETETLLTLGVKPNRPETGYGYIQIDSEIAPNYYKVKTFTEKPTLEWAKVFLESGEFYWNSGIFLWNVNTIIKAVETFLPALAQQLTQDTTVFGTEAESAYIQEHFPSCPNISIDFGIMEKAANVCVSLGDFGWSDLGTWSSLYDLSKKDASDNVLLKGKTLQYNTRENIVTTHDGKLVVIDGLQGYLVADTDSVLLICKKDDEHLIRKYVSDVQLQVGEDFI